MRFTVFIFLFGCTQMLQGQQASSDSLAVKIAHDVINAIGGIEAFDETGYIGWQFFESRQIIWDKIHERVRVDYLKKDISLIADINGNNIKLFMNGEEIHQPDSLKKYLNKAKLIWMNDSYWLIMPFKLLDPGVNLKYLGIYTTLDSMPAKVLELTFNEVGATPQNKYWIYIDPVTNFIVQWDYYDSYKDPQAEFKNSWGQYEKYGEIYLSGDRGTEGKLSHLHVWDDLPESIFNEMRIPPMQDF